MPNNGDPTAAATPWNINKTPKAFVSNSRPVSSTIMVDLKDAKQANKKKMYLKCLYLLYLIIKDSQYIIIPIELNMSMKIFYSSNYQYNILIYLYNIDIHKSANTNPKQILLVAVAW